MTQILAPTAENLSRAAEALARGEVVGMPTETVYGLAGVALDERALANIFQTKERPTFDPLIVHFVPSELRAKEVDWIEQLGRQRLIAVERLEPVAQTRVRQLAEAFWPGPLTLVLPKHSDVPDLATSGLETVALRVPRHPVAQQLIAAVGKPLAAPSANRFGRISPTSAADVLAELGGRIAWIIDGGPCEIGLESTVLAVAPDGALTLLRPGGTPQAAIEAVTGARVARAAASQEQPTAPGMLASHYAPTKPLRLLPKPVARLGAADRAAVQSLIGGRRGVGVLLFAGDPRAAKQSLGHLLAPVQVEVLALSETGDVEQAARRFFAALRALDDSPAVELLLAEPVPIATGLGHALADRLARASA